MLRNILVLAGAALVAVSAVMAADKATVMAADEATRDFSPKERQADLARLRNFVYPPGYSDETIIALENGNVPVNLSVPEYLRVHCGEMTQVVLYPCLLRHGERGGEVYTVVSQGGTKNFAEAGDATAYFRERLIDTVMQFESEVVVLNDYIDKFCDQVASGASRRDILATHASRPRISHPIAPPNGQSKFQFSSLFQWERCTDCVGIVAVNQARHDEAPRCVSIHKQGAPRISYFVVDQRTTRGHGSLADGIAEFERRVDAR